MKKIISFILLSLTGLSLVSCQINITNSSNTSNSSSISQATSNTTTPEENTTEVSFTGSDLKIGQSFKLLSTVDRTIPIESDEGNIYPTYGTSISNITEDLKKALIAESNYLKASDSTYNKMDEFGNLYLDDTLLERKFYKHTTSNNNYYGTPSDDEKAVIKEISISSRSRGNHITGLYAPAGEVIKIELSKEDLEKTGGVKIEMGQYSQNNELNNIWQARNDFSRMPLLGNEMLVNGETTYVGTFLGGPIYVTPINPVDFTITISGALEYCHFIYGLTTKEEFERLKNTSSPFFDLEVWDKCVRHSGPKSYANLDYDNLCQISEFWLSVSNISRQIPSGSTKDLGINFIYDPFIAAGSAVAFVGRNWCNLPPSWMKTALNYESFTTNGDWGPIHEYNHHFQRYGFNPGDEVTNNALSILSYISYTQISAKRPNLSGWNRYLDPYTSLNETLSQSQAGTTTSSLNTYVDIIHTFGVDTFIKCAQYKNGAGGVDNWYESLCEVTNYNMSYYFSLLNQTVSNSLLDKYSDYPLFIPVSFKYQTGRVINNEKNITVLPYPIEQNQLLEINLDEALLFPSDFDYKIKNVTHPQYGTLTLNDKLLTYNPDNLNNSGEIDLTIELTNKETNEQYEETIIFELKPQYSGIDAVRYTYDKTIYTTIQEAYNNDFSGYTNKKVETINKHFVNGIKYNEIYVYYGKIYMTEDGEYTISVRTSNRSNTLLELDLNTPKYSDIIDSKRTNPINMNDTQFKYNVKKGDYIYFRMTIQSFHNDGFAELFGGYNSLSTINTTYLYNNNQNKDKTLPTKDYYPRSYNITNDVSLANQKIISVTEAYSEWDSSYNIANILDGDTNTSYHSIRNKMITSEPFELTIDLGNSNWVDTLKIIGYNGSQMHNPITFTLYGGETLDNLIEIGSYTNLSYSGRNLELVFKKTKIRYYKLVITDTSSHRYIAISEINMGLSGKIISPYRANYYVKNNQEFKSESSFSTFGYSISGIGTIKINTINNCFGMKTQGKSKIKLIINGNENIITFDDYYYLELDDNTEITIEILDKPITIDYFII